MNLDNPSNHARSTCYCVYVHSTAWCTQCWQDTVCDTCRKWDRHQGFILTPLLHCLHGMVCGIARAIDIFSFLFIFYLIYFEHLLNLHKLNVHMLWLNCIFFAVTCDLVWPEHCFYLHAWKSKGRVTLYTDGSLVRCMILTPQCCSNCKTWPNSHSTKCSCKDGESSVMNVLSKFFHFGYKFHINCNELQIELLFLI